MAYETYTGSPVDSTTTPTKDHGTGRICRVPGCPTHLSRYTAGDYCWPHRLIEYPYERPFAADGRHV